METDIEKPKVVDVVDDHKPHFEDSFEEEEFLENEKLKGDLLSKTDDPSIPAFTFRTVTIGIVMTIFVMAANAILAFRSNPILLPHTVSVMVGYPIGVAMSKLLPKGILNPGPFSLKEHVLINVITFIATKSPESIDAVIVQKYYLGSNKITLWPSFAFVLLTQLISIGLAGITQRFLVKPGLMLWPYNFSMIAMYRVFHGQSDQDAEKKDEAENLEEKTSSMSRSTFFLLVFGFIFLYELIPNYFATIISTLSVVCFVSKSRWATLIGSSTMEGGVGLFALTFDWALMQNNEPIYTPFSSIVNLTISGAIWTWIVPLIVEYTNAFRTPFLRNTDGHVYHDGTPFQAMNSVRLFNRTGYQITTAQLVDKTNFDLNEKVFNQNKPIYLSSLYSVSYLAQFMLITSTMSHVILWNGKTIVRQLKDMWYQRDGDDGDIHTDLMKSYKEIPEWVYAVYVVVLLVIQIVVLKFTAFKIEWWVTFLAFVISFIFVLPTGLIQALTNTTITIDTISEFIIGAIIPGKTIPVISAKAFALAMQTQALDTSCMLKLGFYMHISPLAMFASQIIGAIVGNLTTTLVSFWMMDSALDGLQEDGSEWDAIEYAQSATSGAISGSIGPARMFGRGSPYFSLLMGFPIGAILPVIPWLANKYYPSRWWRYFSIPLLCSNIEFVGQNNAVIVMPFLVGFVFNYYIFNHHYDWWNRYTYTMGSALDSGTSIAIVFSGILSVLDIKASDGVLNPFQQDAYCFGKPPH